MKIINVLVIMYMIAAKSFGDLARFEALVIDADTGLPISNVVVEASFGNDNGWKAWTESAPINHDTQTTDSYGRCRLSGKTNNGEVGCWVGSKQQNHYGVKSAIEFKLKRRNLFGVWQPENLVVTMALQRVECPIPLFVKSVCLCEEQDIVDRFGGRLSYDLLIGDWLPPMGKGARADIIVERFPRKILGHAELQGRPDIAGNSFHDEVKITFPGKGNGIIDMNDVLKGGLPIKTAPNDGFAAVYTLWQEVDSNLKYKNSNNKGKCLCFRIRTQMDGQGCIKRAYYGKIYGDINIRLGYAYSIGGIGFLYYLNPTQNDRNLEWDQKNNFCANPGTIGQPQP